MSQMGENSNEIERLLEKKINKGMRFQGESWLVKNVNNGGRIIIISTK